MRDGNTQLKRDGEPGWIASLLGAGVLIAGGFALGLVAGVVSEEPELVVGHLVGRSEEVAWAPDAEPEFTTADEQVALLGDPGSDASGYLADASDRAAAPRVLRQAPQPKTSPQVAPQRAEPEPALPAVAAAPPKRRDRREPQEIDSLPQAKGPESAPAPSPQRAAASATSPSRRSASVLTRGYAVQVGAFADDATASKIRNKLVGRGFDSYVITAAESGDGKWRVRVGPVETKGAAERLASRLKTEERLPTWVLAVGGG